MAVDIYLRNSTDPTYEEGRAEISEELDLFLQQIEMVILTPKGSVMGDPDYGASLDTYLWSFGKTGPELEAEAMRQINKYCSYRVNYDVEIYATVQEINFQDIAVIDIAINGAKLLGLAIK